MAEAVSAHAVRVQAHGGAEVLSFDTVEVAAPAAGQVRLRQTAIGLNFVDTYFRTGLYPAPGSFPFIPGSEGVGIVEAVGEGVSNVRVGDRVGYGDAMGSYADIRLAPAARMIPIPEGISDTIAASVLLKGMTARYLLRETFKVGPGHTILFHAAAGGVGQIATQWAKALGATVIGTVGSPEKAAIARRLGCDHVIDYRSENFVDRVLEITGGAKLDVVYDSVGKDTFPASLDCLKRRGLWVSFGQSSGPVPPFNIGILNQKGSLFATRPSLAGYISDPSELAETAKDLFDVLASGKVIVAEPQTFRLADATEAHRALEGRKTSGSVVLIP
ncbi:quinone oxidoreductase family protein [Kaistia adipata]|uniref:quinone oxidoreductase family protein n=1 Tax=Kaistia adipata TaxID=166954 RepID=UPI0003F98403|nr:quinone oxidoreductase [Kaistia adipata]